MSITLIKRSLPPDGESQPVKRTKIDDSADLRSLLDPVLCGSSPVEANTPSAADSIVDDDARSSTNATTTTPGTPTTKRPPREKKFICDYPNCGKGYARPVRLAEHKRSHTNERPFVCDREACGKAFLRESHLKAHVKSHHEDLRDYVCDWPDCGKGYTTGQKLREHRKRHEIREELKCNTCGQFFRKQETLDRHMTASHSADPFLCEHVVDSASGHICGQAFQKYPALKQHQDRAHSGYKFFCHNCSPEQNEDDMDDSASQVPAVVGFTTFTEYQRHLKDVHPPTCQTCGQVCATEAKLRAHVDIEHFSKEERRTVKCKEPTCDKMFTRNGNMLVHYKSEHENQKFICEPAMRSNLNNVPDWDGHGACGRGFSTKAALEKHIQAQHLHIPLKPSKGKEKRRARKARMAAQEEDAMALDDSQSQYSRAANLLTGSGVEYERQIRCILEFCPQKFRRWYDLELHLQASHGYSDLAASDAADTMREKEALSGGQFWLGGDVDDEFEDLELAAHLQAALGVRSPAGQ
ncbi:Transcription factor IIIA-like protein [Elsinoe fawcettii]|nr:Transcription factor IIIA-like protein [Elsinoe fawcettii]